MNHRILLALPIALVVFTIHSLAQTQFQTVNMILAGKGYSITPLPGDYDGDGDMDILGTGSYVKDALSVNVTVLFRNDGGEFVVVDTQLPWFYYGGMYQWADLDNDNDLDIIAGGCTSYCYNTKVLSIYRNDGADKFTQVTQQTNLIGGKLFSLIDYNNDGLIDIEIATQSDIDDSIVGRTFYKNTGNFVFENTFQLPAIGGEVAWGDLDNDGWLDFVLLNRAYQNLHDGTFQAFSSSITMQSNTKHFFFDADHDGDQDVITSNGILMENDGSGQLSFGSIFIPSYTFIRNLLIADFDGDGDTDIVVSGGTSNQNRTQLFRSNDDGTFAPENLNEAYPYSFMLAVADMDNDNDPDLLASGVFLSDIIIFENGITTELENPGVPTNLQSSINSGSITFSWDIATDQEQSSLNYNMYLRRGDKFTITPIADLTTGKSFIPSQANVSSNLQKEISTLVLPEGYFEWSVQSVDNELNTSEFAAPHEFTHYSNNPANAPTNLIQTAFDNQSVTLTWTDNSNDETTFTIERSSLSGNAGFESIGQVTFNTINYIDNTVIPRSVYYYRIRLDGSSAVAYSNVIKIETLADVAIAPTHVTATVLNSASVKIAWDYLGTDITGFVIERSPDDKNHFAEIGSTAAEELTYTDRHLESGRTYYYRVLAANGEETSNYSNIANVSVPQKEFSKITLPSLMYDYHYIMGGIAWGDYDHDGYDDLFLGYKAQLFRNKGDGTFEQVLGTGFIASENAHTFVAVWGDYDQDGLLDIFYYNDQDKSSLYRGHGDGTFTKIYTVINADRSDLTSATWADVDMDGDLDLSMTGGRYFYRYDGDDTFVRINFPGGNPPSYYNSSVASWADYDDDGDPDVFLGNYGKDEFFRNNGDGSFTAITNQRITDDYNFDCCPITTPTALWTDFNNDRKLDITIFHAEEPIYAYTNDANNFDSAFYSFEYNRESWKNLFWTDYDSDGDLDLFCMGQYNLRTSIWVNREGQSLNKLKGGPLYDYVLHDANFSWNDFDNDGYSDLFQFDSDHQVFKNISNGNSWIKIRLKGHDSNSNGVGAKVFVKSNGQWQRSDVTTHHSFSVQQGFMSLFGLGKSTQVDSIKINWPSGNIQYLIDVDVNQVILINETNAQEKVPQAPSNLIAEAVYPSSILLKWKDRSDDETGFVIEMMTEGESFSPIGMVGANVTSFNVSGLSVGVKYKFRVRSSQTPNKWTNIAETQIRLFKEVFSGDLTTFTSKSDGMAWGDPDNDGDPDLFVGSQSSERDAVYYNDNGSFTRKYLRNNSNYSRQAQWVDYNNDGYQDLHISVGGGILATTEYYNDFLYKNDGSGQLVEQSGHILASDGYPDFTAAWGDLNKDGDIDMIALRPADKTPVFLNLGGVMTPQQGSLGLNLYSGLVMLSDLDNDNDPDLIGSDSYSYSALYENANGQFNELTNSGLPYLFGPFVFEDFSNDGVQDMLLIDQDQKLALYLFDPIGLKFMKAENVFSSLGQVSKVSAGDFDNNGYLDIFITGFVNFTSNTNRILLNNGNLNFTSLTDPILELGLFGTAVADANKDGHLDLIVLVTDPYYDARRYLLRGSKTENHWLRVKLKGVGMNKFGIGARIRLFTGNTSQVREICSGSGGTYSDEQIAHFGLGNATAIDYIKVEWPSGIDQWIANPSIDIEITVEQASSPGPPAPADPTNLVATYASRAIDLQWNDNSDNETRFRIERAIGTQSFETFMYVPANTTSYTDNTFNEYTGDPMDVKYRIVAVSYVSVESAPSNEASVSVITGIEEEASESLGIYPQPASSKVFVRSENKIQSVTIIGGRGEVLKKISFLESLEVEVPLTGFAPGLYFLLITDDIGTRVKKMLIAPGN